MSDVSGGRNLRRLAEATRLHASGALDDAEAIYAAVLRDTPDDPVALINGGSLALARNDLATARARLARATRVAPRNAIAHNNLGFALLHDHEPAAALGALDRAVELQRDYAQAHNNRGIALSRLGRDDDARRAFARALELDPNALDAALNLADLHARDGEGERARAAFERALVIDPASVVARTGHAFAQALAGDLDGARVALDEIGREHPDTQAVQKTRAAVANWSWDHEGAEAAFRAALASSPDDDEAAFGVASTLLARGRFAEGFAAFERRREGIASSRARYARFAAWDGRRLDGTLLLCPEQGLGDVVQFARFIATARERVARVVLLLDGYWKPLAPLLALARGVDRVVTADDALATEDIGARASVLSLPHLVGLTPDSVPGAPYLAAPAERRTAWAARLASVARPRVGLAWSVFARSDYGYVTKHKSIPAASLAPILAVEGVQFVTLQPGTAGDPTALGAAASRVTDLRDAIADFADTAALVAELDLVIAPDTAVAHVAGALGVPVWMLDRYNSCWRWRHPGGERTPWYDSMRIFRQVRFNDWTDPVSRAAGALRALARNA
jgi:Flp pilus assembly protein TadD